MSDALPPPQIPSEVEFGWALGAMVRAYRERVNDVLGDLPQGARGYQTLSAVIQHMHESQLALAGRLGIDRTVMTYLVDDLETAGLVERQANPADRRQRQIVATDQGQQTVAELCVKVAEAEESILGALDHDERRELRRLLNKAACAIVDGADPCTEITAFSDSPSS